MPAQPVVVPIALPSGLSTPALVIDLDVVERNAVRMAAAVGEHGIGLRPHTKTHKSVALARIQLDAGAKGITVGTLGEAEVMAAAGIADIFIAYPVWAVGAKADRLRALVDGGTTLSVGIDSIGGAEQLAAAIRGTSRTLRVLVEVDPRNGRTGVSPSEVGPIAMAAQRLGLEVCGAFAHGGHAYSGPGAVAGAAADEVQALAVAAASLAEAGAPSAILSAGSSPTALGDLIPPVTEVRPGTYLLGDRQQVCLGASPADGVAICVAATVVSTSVPGQVVIDAGAKSLTKDLPPYLEGYGALPAYPDGVIERVSDYHGVVRFPAGSRRPDLGEVVAVIPNHACPVVDLYDEFVATRSGTVIDEWPVDARGRSG